MLERSAVFRQKVGFGLICLIMFSQLPVWLQNVSVGERVSMHANMHVSALTHTQTRCWMTQISADLTSESDFKAKDAPVQIKSAVLV